METRTAQVAKATGIYRCTGIGCTKYCETNQTLPICNCRAKPCVWELLKEDNLVRENEITIFVGRGIIHAMITDELPELGSQLNIRSEMNGVGLRAGLYHVAEIQENFRWASTKGIWINVQRIGELLESLPIHSATPLNC